MNNNTSLSDRQESIQNTKYEHAEYWDMMDPAHGPDEIVDVLINILPEKSSVFEYGAGRGRNALPLAMVGHSVTVQDIASRPMDELANTSATQLLDIKTSCGSAVEYILEGQYDAFICIRILHFMSVEQAWKVIENMQSHTIIGGYNALVVMILPTVFSTEYFCPTVEEISEKYTGWEIVNQDVTSSKPSVNSNGRSMTRLSILLKKTSLCT